MPLVSSGMNNNGICAMVDESINARAFPSGSITVDMFGTVFYQNKEYYAVSHGRVNVLIPKTNIEEYTGLFLSSMLQKQLKENIHTR